MIHNPLQTSRIVVIGVFAADLTFRAERLPAMGETLAGRGFAIGPGGKGSNQAIAAARAAGDVYLLTAIGQDAFAELARNNWADAGVHQDGVLVQPEHPTGTAFIFVSTATGENAIIIESGAAGDFTPQDVEAQEPLIAGASVLMAQLEQPLAVARAGLEIARRHGVTTILNPAPAADLPPDIYPLCDLITPNESEAEQLTGIPVNDDNGALRAAEELRRRGVANVVITLGARGALLLNTAGPRWFGALSGANVVDTSGAGDAFNGSLAVELARGAAIADAINFATVAAGLSIQQPGTASSMPLRNEIEARLRSHLQHVRGVHGGD